MLSSLDLEAPLFVGAVTELRERGIDAGDLL